MADASITSKLEGLIREIQQTPALIGSMTRLAAVPMPGVEPVASRTGLAKQSATASGELCRASFPAFELLNFAY